MHGCRMSPQPGRVACGAEGARANRMTARPLDTRCLRADTLTLLGVMLAHVLLVLVAIEA